jgi:hypothetical protein
MLHSVRRAAALVAAPALATLALVATPTPASAGGTYDPTALAAAASWIGQQTSSRGLLESGYEDLESSDWVLYDDQGLTIDAVESLAEAGAAPATVAAMTDAVEDTASEYASYGPGSKAKLLVLADTAHRDLATFGGGGLAAGVENEISTGTASEGRLENAFGSVLAQAYAARALTAVGSPQAGSSVDYLLRQQCSAGFFRESFASGDDCVDGTSAPSVDATAVAVLELSGHVATPAVTTALADARAWLATKQLSDGSWDAAAAAGEGNANTTGLAARAIGASAAAEKAAGWLWRHQAASTDPAVLAKDTGAISVDDATYADGRSSGLDERSRTLWVRATAQALATLRWLPSASTGRLVLSGPSGYQRARTSVTLRLTGTKPGDRLTLVGPGVSRSVTAASTSWSVRLTLPAGTAQRSYRITDNRGHAAVRSVRVLGAARLVAQPARHRVKRGHAVTVRVRGLAPNEYAQVRYRGHVVRVGHADAHGRFSAKVRVGRSLGVKVIRAYGRFGEIRHGRTAVRVVR